MTTYDQHIDAHLVYDGGNEILVPPTMGTPKPDQLQGTVLERLAELACRICYDSLGAERSRGSEALHKHILEVGHLSVYEHANLTFEIKLRVGDAFHNLSAFINRPGVWIEQHKPGVLRVTCNLRTLIEWKRWTDSHRFGDPDYTATVGNRLCWFAYDHAPRVVGADATGPSGRCTNPPAENDVSIVEPMSDHERWVSLYVSGSRGLSHELVRHGDFTAMSQRSTRYCDEDGSPQVEHPLITEYLCDQNTRCCIGHELAVAAGTALRRWEASAGVVPHHTRLAYRNAAADLESWLLSRGVDKFTARKQARGAARGYLPNSLHTELIFSATVAQWRWMLQQRASAAADAEIRILFCKVLMELKKSRYADRFADMVLTDSPDGIGEVLAFLPTNHA